MKNLITIFVIAIVVVLLIKVIIPLLPDRGYQKTPTEFFLEVTERE